MGDFRNTLRDFTGLGDLDEGIDHGDWGQAAWGGANTLLTFVPSAVFKPILGGLGKAGVWALDRIDAWAMDGAAHEIAPAISGLDHAGETANGGAGLYHPRDGGPHPTLYDPNTGKPFLELPRNADNPKLTWPEGGFPTDDANIPRPRGTMTGPDATDVIPAGPKTRWGQGSFDPAGIGKVWEGIGRAWEGIGEAITGVGDKADSSLWPFGRKPSGWGPGTPHQTQLNPYDKNKLQQWLEDHGITKSDTEPRWYGPKDAKPWYGAPEDTPKDHWPVGIAPRSDGQWYRPRWNGIPGNGTITMPDWAKAPTDIQMRGKLLDGTSLPIGDPENPEVDQMLWKLNMVDDAQLAAKPARDAAETKLKDFLNDKDFRIDIGGGKTRAVGVDDLSRSSLESTLEYLGNPNRGYDQADLKRLENLADTLSVEKGTVSQLSEIRGEIGGDYYADQQNIKIIYRGSGPNDVDRLGIITGENGNEEVVDLELKGGDKPDSLSSRAVSWNGEKIKVEQGTLPYAQDEFRDGSKALQALKEYNPELAEKLLNGETPLHYRLVHTAPGTHKITAYEFDPGEAGEFRLKPPTAGPGTTPPPTAGATPIAAMVSDTATVSGISDLVGSSVTAALASLSALTLPLLGSPSFPLGRNNPDKSINQSLAVNITTRPPSSTTINRENARVMAYGAHVR
ncbi:hypothetical protein ACFYTS_10790 [Nocardia sp. NPDC004151]|uniref:hypothetical protein n=1 Tax=Nocardia sp. NPDC004151 TaxID=3364304 RepID=UPI0036B9A79A